MARTAGGAAVPVWRRAPTSSRVRAIRTTSLLGLGGVALAAVYTLATPHGPNRPAMLVVMAVMSAVFGLTWWYAAAVALSRAQAAIRLGGLLVYLVGLASLSLFDGGVTRPLGSLLPLLLIFMALFAPPRVFAALAVLAAAAYWTVAFLGDRAPPGYVSTYTIGLAGVAYLCLRYAGALASLRRRLAEVSRIDPLTQALNRRGFDEQLESEFAEAVRMGTPLTLVLADLDRFKEINDTYGHQAGDQLLAWAVTLLKQELRGHGTVSRIGGDEFAVVLSDTDPEEVAVVAQRLRASLDAGLPASIGHASFPADATTLDDLKRVADERVYQDKIHRSRRPPPSAAVAAAREVAVTAARAAAADRPVVPMEVCGRERRRRSVADMGRVSLYGYGIGGVYAAVFGGGWPHRLPIGLVALAGGAIGLTLVLAAGRLSRSAAAGPIMLACGCAMGLAAAGMAALGGGVGTIYELILLAPMPLIALTTPIRLAAPVMGLFSTLYVVVGVMVNAPGGWHIVLHLLGTLGLCAVCSAQGRTAARQRRLLTELSRVDVLTNVLNRRGFAERFAAELAHAHRTGRPISLLVLDLDGFKLVNDAYGHAAGDELLRWVAATLAADLHPQDSVGRIGGDEFIILLNARTAEQAPVVAERLRGLLAARTKVSIGTATLGRDGTDFDTLYAHADADLYAQKSLRPPAPRPTVGRQSARRQTITADGSVVAADGSGRRSPRGSGTAI